MLTAHEIKKGSFIRYQDGIHQIMENDYHKGAGKMGNFYLLKIKDLRSGRVHEVKMDPSEKIEELTMQRRKMKYLYEDASGLTFMDPATYEQATVSSESLGNLKAYLKEDTEVEVVFHQGAPISVNMPEKVMMEVTSTGEGIRGDTDNVFKPATLDNGMEILVPQFIKTGDKVMVNVETGKYAERVK